MHMLEHPRSHSPFTLSLASVFGLHVSWAYFSQARLPFSHSDGRCSSSLLSSLPVKSGHLHRSFLFLPFAIVSSLRLLQWSPADAPGRKRALAGLSIASWVAVALEIVRRREFTCMHCGEICIVKV